MVRIDPRARAYEELRLRLVNQMQVKNASAERPVGQHWDLDKQDYVADGCEEGYHWDDNTYRCVPD